MSLQFPASPALNYQFTATNGVQYTWDGKKWVANKDLLSGGGGISAGLWLRDDATGTLYPEIAGDNVSIRNGSGTETIGLSREGIVEPKGISFTEIQQLT